MTRVLTSGTRLPRLLLAAVILAVFVSAGTVRGQNSVDPETVEDFIDQTGELLDTARDVVQDSGSLQARRVLGEATRLHQRSRMILGQDRPPMALSTSRRARAATFHAMRLAREALVFSERYQLQAERFARRRDELLDKAREEQNRPALDLLGRADHQDKRARELYNQGDARQAFRILEQVKVFQDRAAGLLGLGSAQEDLDALLSHTADLLERAHGMMGSNPKPRSSALLRDSESALERARDFQRRGMPVQALKSGRLAHDLAEKALLAPAGEEDPAAAAERQIENWDERAGGLPADLDPALADMMARSREHRRRAQAMLAEGHPLMALRQIKLAHDLLDQVEGRIR